MCCRFPALLGAIHSVYLCVLLAIMVGPFWLIPSALWLLAFFTLLFDPEHKNR